MFQRARSVRIRRIYIIATPIRLAIGRVYVKRLLCERTGNREKKKQKDESCPPPIFVGVS